MRTQTGTEGSWLSRHWLLLVTIAAATAAMLAYRSAQSPGSAATQQSRSDVYRNAVKTAAAAKAWPDTPEQVIREFFDAASRKDFQKLTVLCPGSVASDYALYNKWTPSPAKAIGAPEQHPKAPGIAVYPTTVPFPGFPEKTVKMAVVRAPGGRWVIDGQHTIWW